jgi:hypothetical protein
MYGCESWSLTKNEENKINIFERKILRKIYGQTNDNGVWRIRYNQELYGLYNEPYIIKMVKASRLRWLGHLCRTEELNPCKKLIFSKPIGTRKKGRQPVRWLDNVQKDLQTLGDRNWKEIASDRIRWRGIVKAVLAWIGL